MPHHHHHKHHRATELVNWGESEVYSLRNVATGMYLAAHEDGELVCEDADLKHHDIPWNIAYHPDSHHVALYSCINKKWLSVDANNIPNATPEMAGHQEDWLLIEVDKNAHVYALKSCLQKFFGAVPSVDGNPAVFADADKLHDNGKWIIAPTTIPPPRVPNDGVLLDYQTTFVPIYTKPFGKQVTAVLSKSYYAIMKYGITFTPEEESQFEAV